MKSFIYDKIFKYISVGAQMSFGCQKGEFDRFFNRLDRPVEESRPYRQPDRFPSLLGNTLLSLLIGFGSVTAVA